MKIFEEFRIKFSKLFDLVEVKYRYLLEKINITCL